MAIFVAAFAISPNCATGQTQSQQDRIDSVARFTVAATMCTDLGMSFSTTDVPKIQAALANEGMGWSVESGRLKSLIQESFDRQVQVFSADLDALHFTTASEAELRNSKRIYLRFGEICLSASRDPLFSKFLKVPPSFDLDAAATVASDKILESGGFASWQTPRIVARADLATIVGACRRLIGRIRSDEILRTFTRTDDPRERDYYLHSYDEGLNDPELQGWDSMQCERAIRRTRQKIVSLG